LTPPLDTKFILGQIALIRGTQGGRVGPRVEIDEITGRAFPHLMLPFPMDQFPAIEAAEITGNGDPFDPPISVVKPPLPQDPLFLN
jgi:hypothetical protein